MTKNYFTLGEIFRNCNPNEIHNALSNKQICANIYRSWISLNYLRQLYGSPIIINSGYRDDGHNKRVGGVLNSQHKEGIAFDIRSLDLDGLKAFIERMGKNDEYFFGQVIFYRNFVHITFSNSRYPRYSPLYNV